MKIAIIGTGNVGKALGTSFKRAGHDVTFAGRDAGKTREAAEQLGASAAATPSDAVAQADVVVLAIPYTAMQDVAREIASSARGKVVVDVTNPLKPDMSGLMTEGGPSAGETVAAMLADARVVKAFNTIFASVQADPAAQGTTIDGLFATDDGGARSTTARLLGSIGLRPVYVGSIARARELEAMAWLNMQMQMAHQGSWNTSFVLVSPPAASVAEPGSGGAG